MRILLVEDSKRLQRSISRGLRACGYKVDVSGDGEEGLWFAQSHDYDVIILDIMLPKRDGLSVLRELRAQEKSAHVLILSARDTVEDRVLGLECGADDYLTKPFSFDELLARIRALVRRRYESKTPVVAVADIEIDTATRKVSRGGRDLELPPREYALLELLTLRRGAVVTRSEIEEHIYDERAEPLSNVVDAAICSLRRRIDKPGEDSLIKTRRRVGYLIE